MRTRRRRLRRNRRSMQKLLVETRYSGALGQLLQELNILPHELEMYRRYTPWHRGWIRITAIWRTGTTLHYNLQAQAAHPVTRLNVRLT